MIDAIIAFDLWFENLMLATRTPVLLDVMRAVTFFGNTTTVIAIAVILSAYLVISRKSHWPYLAGIALALLGAFLSGSFLKTLVARARPDEFMRAVTETTFSFPSGHAIASVVLYGFIAFIFSRRYPEYRKAALVAAGITIVLIGFSRLYLGVHFPTDVLAGYLLGGAWLMLGVGAVRKIQSSRYFSS